MTGAIFRNLATCEIGSNNLEIFFEISTLEKYMKSLKISYEKVHILV